MTNFNWFQGWKLLALIVVTVAYSVWFTTAGPYGQLESIIPGGPLEARGFYSGADAVAALSSLEPGGEKAKYISLLFDLPYMILTTLMMGGLIAFGIRRMNLTRPVWSHFLILPVLFLIADFLEDSFIALTLATGSEAVGSIAGFLTAAKFATFIPANIAALAMGLGGLVVWLNKSRTQSSE